jgi:6-phosphogluconolactonase
MPTSTLPRQRTFNSLAELEHTAAQTLLDSARHAIAERGAFHIVLAGGSTPRGVYRLLKNAGADWSAWHIWFGDERCLPPGNTERNSRMAAEVWLDIVTAIPREQIHPIPAELGAEAAAAVYASALKNVGEFDLVLLGLGEDGHTASLFPEHELGAEENAPDALAVYDAPKPPPERVSLSAQRLNRARRVIFLVAGESKQEAMRQWREGVAIPAAAIAPAGECEIYWVR